MCTRRTKNVHLQKQKSAPAVFLENCAKSARNLRVQFSEYALLHHKMHKPPKSAHAEKKMCTCRKEKMHQPEARNVHMQKKECARAEKKMCSCRKPADPSRCPAPESTRRSTTPGRPTLWSSSFQTCEPPAGPAASKIGSISLCEKKGCGLESRERRKSRSIWKVSNIETSIPVQGSTPSR